MCIDVSTFKYKDSMVRHLARIWGPKIKISKVGHSDIDDLSDLNWSRSLDTDLSELHA